MSSLFGGNAKKGTWSDSRNDGPQETTRLLADSVRLAKETERIEDATIGDLNIQGEQLRESRKHLSGIQDMASSTSDTVKRMKIKVFRQKLVLWSVMVGLFIIIVTLLYVLIQNRGHF